MKLLLTEPAVYILSTLEAAGFEAYIVGGAVRDAFLHEVNPEITVTDLDFTTNAVPEQIVALFADTFYENEFGTVSIPAEALHTLLGYQLPSDSLPQEKQLQNRVIDAAEATKLHSSLIKTRLTPLNEEVTPLPAYQITTFRAGEVYDNHRQPSSMTWGSTLNEDLQRRDFTINAMAIDLQGAVIDPFNGQADLKNNLIRTVGDATTRFQEDALRMLRAIRFSVQLNMELDRATFSAIDENAELLSHISGERIRDEFLKILKSSYPAEGVELLDEASLLRLIVPELLMTKGVQQGGHHTTDVWIHSLDALRHCPSRDPIVRLATLLHDIAKPATSQTTQNQITFYNHEVIGARVAKAIAERLRLSKRDANRIFVLVRQHMFYYQPENTDAAIRRMMRKIGLENIDDILALREGDRLGSGARKTSWRLEELKQRMIGQLHQPFAITDLAVNGTDIIEHFKVKAGPVIGQTLQHLFELVLEKPELNDRTLLLAEAEKYLDSTIKK
ncbi:MAG: HDIG domain-containing protein [bacterium]|nr:HDIG domain-containing protein [bacterium]